MLTVTVRMVDLMLQIDDQKSAAELIQSDEYLKSAVVYHLAVRRRAICNTFAAIEVLHIAHLALPSTANTKKSDLYVQAMSGKLRDSPRTRGVLLAIKKMTSDVMEELLGCLVMVDTQNEQFTTTISDLNNQLSALLSVASTDSGPLRSEHDLKKETLRTTVVAQKVELSKNRSALSKDDSTYTQIALDVYDALKEYLQSMLADFDEPFLTEVFTYDFKSSVRDVSLFDLLVVLQT
jgi:origin recognition complex subunit 3